MAIPRGRGPARLLAAALSILGPAAHARAQCPSPTGRPSLGLVLSGGGARGLAHVGVLKALEEKGLRPDCIAGSSMGALIGALYASGYSAARIEQIVRSVDWQRIYSGRPERSLVPLARRVDETRPLVRVEFDFWHLRLPPSAEPDYRLRRFLFSLLAAPSLRAERDFDRLPIPFRAVAADLATGERVILAQGSLEMAARASISAPVALEPVKWRDRWLVDGGVVDNLPVGVARAMGAQVVIAVDTRSPPARPQPDADALGVATQLADMLIRHRNQDFAQPADVVVVPALEGLTNTSFGEYERALAEGHRAAQAQLASISPGEADRERLPERSPDEMPPRPIAALRVEGEAAVRESLVREAAGLAVGEPFDLDRALRGLDAVWATRLFRSAWLDVLPAGPGLEVVVHVREAERRLAELGASWDESDKAAGSIRLRERNLFGRGEGLDLLARASEAETRLQATLSVDGLFGSALGYFMEGLAAEERPRRFREHALLGRAEFDRLAVSVGVQTHLGPSALLRAGLRRGRVSTVARAGVDLPSGTEQLATVSGLAMWDTLDDGWHPTRGGAVSLSLQQSLTGLGASHGYWHLQGNSRWAASLGRAGVLELGLLGFTSGGSLPVHEQVRLGGPSLVPGLQREELWGAHGAAGALVHRLPVLSGLRLILRAGAGGTWPERRAISIRTLQRGLGTGLELRTPVGPISAEWGRTGGESRLYFSIGYR